MPIRYDQERGGVYIPIMRRKIIARESRATVVLLGDLFRVYMHRVPDVGSVPCLGDLCRFCHELVTEFRWYGPACRYQTKTIHQLAIVEWWQPTVGLFSSRVGNRPSWRGLTVEYIRPRDDNEKMVIKLAENQIEEPLPQPFDIWPVLTNLWGPEYTSEVAKHGEDRSQE
jgi:hypothetical protein